MKIGNGSDEYNAFIIGLLSISPLDNPSAVVITSSIIKVVSGTKRVFIR
ncbi:MAG: hypothetical protein QXY87_08115 [Saccharolobus sp.]|uniref:Uncharacterized protein n=1 Tax=Saccharolobus shibatae (strain ATCC 51178 / DSM 5389 / JCM 8931 / NBRC 15437 / B12) TaxID=523848 RepID=A0A8F5GSA0_SACSH|nr:hypothetical protein [Saccharolobus shibatae]MCH4815620.1 hypothetical protein [Saccharolobus shibatae]QXJ27658.1 hypothetical protein J5U23_00525 [Saccharolobus shibatae B12]